MKKLFLVALFASFSAYATDFGVVAKAYPIAEEDLLEFMKRRAQVYVDSGRQEKDNKDLLKRNRKWVERPAGVILPRAKQYRLTELNVVYTLDHDVYDADGVLLHAKGTQVNPLKLTPLTKWLCFFDGDDAEQVAWVEANCTENVDNKLILINGPYQETKKKMKRTVFFDQYAFLTQRFNLQALPTVVRQHGESLYVEEFPIN